MTYQEALDYLYNQFPVYQKIGAKAMNPGLDNSLVLDEWLGHPHASYRTIHVAGTNGKGSTSHTLASILQSSGYKVGLYTSPHLVDFRERIRVNGEKISETKVVAFVERCQREMPSVEPSFFELTMMMAFDYFRKESVDVAVVEVGLGGRLDSTNIINPDLCVITNIGLEHTAFLGDTLGKIAREKAGIMKRGVNVVIGEKHEETDEEFKAVAKEKGAPLTFAQEEYEVVKAELFENKLSVTLSKRNGDMDSVLYGLSGLCQQKNIVTVMAAVDKLKEIGYEISGEELRRGLRKVVEQTGLMGRWQKIAEEPDMIIDTGHNAHGVRLIAEQLKSVNYDRIHIVWGMANDKSPGKVMPMLPQDAIYYYTRANVDRAMPSEELAEIGRKSGREGESYGTVAEAVAAAKKNARANDLIFIGGSNFVIGEVI